MICKRCNTDKPYTEEYFPIRNGKYLRKTCKICWQAHRTEYKRKWREENYTRDFENRQNWYKNNPTYLKDWMKKKRKTDICFKIACYYRTRILRALKGKGKQEKIMELLGCSIEDFKKHIESKFKEGMTWENYCYSGWHIDHKIPCSSFDLKYIEEQKKCFHYTNLQPLWAMENFKKSDN